MARFHLHCISFLLMLSLAAPAVLAQNAPPAPANPAPANPPAPTTAPAADLPPASAVIDRAIAAHGGVEAFGKITSIEYSITTEQPGASNTFRVRSAPPDKTLITMDSPGGRMEFGRNGGVAWRHTATAGFQLIPDTQLGQVTRLHPLGLLLRLGLYREQGESVDRATVQDHACFKVKLPSEQGEVFLYFDEATGVMRGLEEIRTNASAPAGFNRVALMTTFEDERVVPPLTLFHLATMSFGGQALGALRVSDIRYNTLSAELFAVPAEVAKLASAPARSGRPTTQPAASGGQ